MSALRGSGVFHGHLGSYLRSTGETLGTEREKVERLFLVLVSHSEQGGGNGKERRHRLKSDFDPVAHGRRHAVL